ENREGRREKRERRKEKRPEVLLLLTLSPDARFIIPSARASSFSPFSLLLYAPAPSGSSRPDSGRLYGSTQAARIRRPVGGSLHRDAGRFGASDSEYRGACQDAGVARQHASSAVGHARGSAMGSRDQQGRHPPSHQLHRPVQSRGH